MELYSSHYRWLLVGVLGCGLVLGCSRGVRRVIPPPISAAAAGAAAIAQYDRDGDGTVAAEELVEAPSLAAAMGTLDVNNDGRVSADEVTRRIEAWQDSRIGLCSARCRVTLDGIPLEGAQVRMEPELFLGGQLQPATGTTDKNGYAMPTIAEEFRADPQITGVQCGLYRFCVAGPGVPILYQDPATTPLGAEIAIDTLGMERGYNFELRRQP